MTLYKCAKSFTSSTGIVYAYGCKISQIQYDNLRYDEMRNFIMIQEETDPYPSTQHHDYNHNPTPDLGSILSSDSSIPSDNSSNDFGGFGGGSFGGGGAGSSWDDNSSNSSSSYDSGSSSDSSSSSSFD